MWAICDTFSIQRGKQRDKPLIAITLIMVTWVQLNPFLTLITEVQSFNKWIIRYLHPWDIEMTLYYRVTSPLSLLTHETLVLIFYTLFISSSLCDWLPFPLPLDVISKTRSPWQQLVTSSSPTLVFDGCFYFGGFVSAPIPHWQIAK